MSKPDVQVDIITPVYGSPHFLRGLAETLLKIDAGTTFHWWVIDDDGPQTGELVDLYAELRQDSRVKIIMSKKNMGFAGANNEAARRGKAPFLLLLNSDTRVRQAGWLKRMVDEFSDPQVGVVGPLLLYFDDSDDQGKPAGHVQHAGVVFNVLGQPWHLFMTWHPDNPRVRQRREMNAVTGACLMTRRRFYERIGGLDIAYRTGNFEDVQYCLQMRASGLKVIFTPEVELNHYGGGSGNNATARENEAVFQLKCRDIIEYDDYRYLRPLVKHDRTVHEAGVLNVE